jgi:pimeloyl-ACP methyl ester carboxylesterase
LIEPVLFNVLRDGGNELAFQQFVRRRDDFVAALAQGPAEQALQSFLDFWSGHGAWDKLLPEVRAEMLAAVDKVALDWEASFAFAPSRQSLNALGSRTLLLRGDRSPPAMLELLDMLHALMPASTRCIIAGANHFLPMARAADVTQAIRLHLNASSERQLS